MRKAILIATAAALVAMAPQSIPGQRSPNPRHRICGTTTTIPDIAITATATILGIAITAITTTIATIRAAITISATIIGLITGNTTGVTGTSGVLGRAVVTCEPSYRNARCDRASPGPIGCKVATPARFG
jgi:hypothetical protein